MRSFHPSDPSRYLFGLPPLSIAALLAGVLVYIPRKMAVGRVTVTQTGIEWDPGKHDLNIHFPWKDLLYSAPRNPQQMVRSLLLVHRDYKLLLYDFFVPDFELLVSLIAKKKSGAASLSAADGLKIDSGRVGSMPPR